MAEGDDEGDHSDPFLQGRRRREGASPGTSRKEKPKETEEKDTWLSLTDRHRRSFHDRPHFVIFAATYNLLGKWLGGVEVEIKNID
jgi:hypothetical protein